MYHVCPPKKDDNIIRLAPAKDRYPTAGLGRARRFGDKRRNARSTCRVNLTKRFSD